MFWNLSDILIIQLKRFTNNGIKKNQYIEYPEILNMTKYSMNYEENSMKFKLMGLCIQDGSLNGGHYYAACKDLTNGNWEIHNDTHVTPTNIEAVKKENPYCLFYRKI